MKILVAGFQHETNTFAPKPMSAPVATPRYAPAEAPTPVEGQAVDTTAYVCVQTLEQLDAPRRIAHLYAELHERLDLIGRKVLEDNGAQSAPELCYQFPGATCISVFPAIAHGIPGAQVLTAEISQALNSGKHTTTSTSWYWVDEARTTALIDSPGFQEFGLNHIEPMQLAHLMPDLNATLGSCRFYNCTHLHEPGCAVVAHVQTGDAEVTGGDPLAISENRYRLYRELFAELSDKRKY